MKQNNQQFVNIKNCRLCNSSELKLLVNFGEVPLGNNLQSNLALSKSVDTFPLTVMQCRECNHFQLSVSVSPKLLYATNYTYLSGIGKSFVDHLKGYTDWIINKINLKPSSLIVDIGSNDGSLLSNFKEKGYKVCGVDPASKPADIANKKGIHTYNNFFDESIVKRIKKNFGEADLVTSQNVLAHVENLQLTFINIYNLMKDKAFFVFEIGYFKRVLKSGCFDTIYHEHLDYHHALPLSKFLTSIGFDLLHISENDIQGGSIRLLLQKTGEGKIYKQSIEFLEEEKKSILYNKAHLNSWQNHINRLMLNLRTLVYDNINNEDVVIGYGAPTKLTLLLKMSKINPNDIMYIVDDNALKVEKYIPFHGIPIFPSSKIDISSPTVIIIFAWNFSEDIINKIKFIFKAPVKIITPLPEPKIYIL